MNLKMIALVSASAFLIFTMILCILKMIRSKNKENQKRKVIRTGNLIYDLNHNEAIANFGKSMPGKESELRKIFYRAKNPWNMTIATFQFIRFFGLIVFGIAALIFIGIFYQVGLLFAGCAILCFWYPMYYYKALGDEREAEWSKFYEFVWVLQNNLTLYDPAKAYINTKLYIESHAPHDKEIIQGFQDFYDHWNPNAIDDYITKYYDFSITREITQIVFNMHQTGDFPEDSLHNLRKFIIQQQDLTVKKIISGVAGQATLFSLPFLMISVILALMVPMLMQLINYF